MSAPATIRLRPEDDVIIATRPIPAGTLLDGEGVTTLSDIPPGHKIATRDLAAGEAVRRYGQIIGLAAQPIAAGSHVHVHNLAMTDVEMDHAIGVDARPTVPAAEPATFMGIRRADGRVATRNYIGIISSVNCSARVVRAIADHFRRDIRPEVLADFPNVDGVVALTHGIGCAVDAQSESMRVVRRTMSGFATHPNFAAVLFIGLGCETNQISEIMAARGLSEGARLKAFTIQDQGGTSKTIAHGIAQIEAMLPEAELLAAERVEFARAAVQALPERIRYVVEQVYFHDRTVTELAEELGVTHSAVSQQRTEGLRLMRLGAAGYFAAEGEVPLSVPAAPTGRAQRYLEELGGAFGGRTAATLA